MLTSGSWSKYCGREGGTDPTGMLYCTEYKNTGKTRERRQNAENFYPDQIVATMPELYVIFCYRIN